jgi:hypothetical protein
MSRIRTFLIAAGLCLAAAPAADAATARTTSTNWAGYAVHRSGVRFREVTAAWRVPAVDCSSGEQQWSASWVGLGGYSETSNALEQIGTESDCSSTGTATYSAWYELVPENSHTIDLTARPGDRISARVIVRGRRVALRLENLTRHRTYSRTLTASAIDVSSAEWIVEAPSACSDTGSFCRVMPLADFGSTAMRHAAAVSAGGHRGAILDSAWNMTAIDLSPQSQQFTGHGGGPDGPPQTTTASTSSTGATTSVVSATGDGFTVSNSS